jgi:hypothetical protein
MDRPAAPAAFWVQWQAPGDGPIADHLARVALRQQQRVASGETRPAVVYAVIVVAGAMLVALTWPAGIGLAVLLALFVVWAKVLTPRTVAKAVRNQPTANEPYTVTLDAEGLHIVGPSVADHLRWRIFEESWIDEDVLVLRRRGVKLSLVIPLLALDPTVDRGWLVDGVSGAIAADARAAGLA